MEPPDRSFFLFGPRGTGKSTWLRTHFPNARYFDLLRVRELLGIMRDPRAFRQEIEALPKGTWIVVDEVQKYPALLDEVHALLEDHGNAYRFALTGSSARKLKRDGINLAGRAVNRKFFPLVSCEMGEDFDLNEVLKFGTLPAVSIEKSKAARIDFLESYVDNYLKEEIQQEAVVKSLDTFTRFLKVAGLANGRQVNVSGMARDAGVTRPTVQGYFQALVDTLIGIWLPAWQPRAKIKEVNHPKFYLFDVGVVRAIAGTLRDSLLESEKGPLLETYLLHELRAFINQSGCGGELSYWRTAGGSEIDFIWSRGKAAIGVEVKAGERWKPEYGKALKGLVDEGVLKRGIGVYGGNKRLKDGPIDVLPVAGFLKALNEELDLGIAQTALPCASVVSFRSGAPRRGCFQDAATIEAAWIRLLRERARR